MKQQLLLLQDVESLGKKGEIVSAKPGYVRNFLLPKGMAVVASSHTLRTQERLRKERHEQAIVDRKESEALAQKIQEVSLEIHVKVDPEGRMYGSVSAHDIVELLAQNGIEIERRFVLLNKPLKSTGLHTVPLRLKEEVETGCKLMVLPEGVSADEFRAAEAAAELARHKKKEEAAALEAAKASEEAPSEEAESSSEE